MRSPYSTPRATRAASPVCEVDGVNLDPVPDAIGLQDDGKVHQIRLTLGGNAKNRVNPPGAIVL